MAQDDLHRIELRAPSIEELRAFIDNSGFDYGCRPVVRREGSEYVMDVYAPMPAVERQRSTRSTSRVAMRVVENSSEVSRERQADVSRTNRFATRGGLSGLGLGIKE